jgi:hypothetical protein
MTVVYRRLIRSTVSPFLIKEDKFWSPSFYPAEMANKSSPFSLERTTPKGSAPSSVRTGSTSLASILTTVTTDSLPICCSPTSAHDASRIRHAEFYRRPQHLQNWVQIHKHTISRSCRHPLPLRHINAAVRMTIFS